MSQTFNCPNCGAPIEYTGNDPIIQCSYCHESVPVPETLRQASLDLQTTQTINQAGRYLIIFIILIVVITVLSVGIPTCLGAIATVIGIALGIAGPIFATIIQFLIKR